MRMWEELGGKMINDIDIKSLVQTKLAEFKANLFLTSFMVFLNEKSLGKIGYSLGWGVSFDKDGDECSILSGQVNISILGISASWPNKTLFSFSFFLDNFPELTFQNTETELIVLMSYDSKVVTKTTIPFSTIPFFGEREYIDKFIEIFKTFWEKLQQNLKELNYSFKE